MNFTGGRQADRIIKAFPSVGYRTDDSPKKDLSSGVCVRVRVMEDLKAKLEELLFLGMTVFWLAVVAAGCVYVLVA